MYIWIKDIERYVLDLSGTLQEIKVEGTTEIIWESLKTNNKTSEHTTYNANVNSIPSKFADTVNHYNIRNNKRQYFNERKFSYILKILTCNLRNCNFA